MISIRKYLESETTGKAEPELRQAVGILLAGMSLHTAESTQIDLARFRQSLGEIADRFAIGLPVGELTSQANLAVTLLEDYRRLANLSLQLPGTESGLREAVAILLAGMSLHALESTRTDHVRFRESLHGIASKFAVGLPAGELAPQATMAVTLLGDYSRLTTHSLQLQGTEFRSMARMLTSAIGTLAATTEENVSKLQDIEETMVSACLLGDVQLVRARLAGCLAAICAEKDRQRAGAKKAAEGLTKELASVRTESLAGRPDPVTGLRPRADAEAAILKACEDPANHFVVAFSLERVQSINVRYGYEVGDNVLRQYTEFLRGRLPKSDALFRWTGVTLVAVLGRAQRAQIVRDEVSRIAGGPIEHTVKTATRAVLLTVAVRWVLLNCMPETQKVLASIDSFAAPRSGAD